MKFTQYFVHVRHRPDRHEIRDEWIERVMASPEAESRQADGRIRLWARIPEASGRYLRVILLEDRETVPMRSSTGDSGSESKVNTFPTPTHCWLTSATRWPRRASLNENVLVELDENGHVVSMTIDTKNSRLTSTSSRIN